MKQPIKAIAVLQGKIRGRVYFVEDLKNDRVILDIHIEGLHLCAFKMRKVTVPCHS